MVIVPVGRGRDAPATSPWRHAAALGLAAWLGAVAFFGAVVAPAAFRVLPTRGAAGALVGATLPVIFIAGIVVGIVVAVASLQARGNGGRFLLALGGAVAAFCAAGQFVIGARLRRLREEIGTTPLEALTPSDPLRVEFGQLHGLSVAMLGLAAVAALLAGVALARSARAHHQG